MDRPCAYCKEFGHHIRYCGLLDNKKHRQEVTVTRVVIPTPVRKVIVTSNMFATIYSSSSDDDVEEGEIVEEDRIIHSKFVDVSDSESDMELTTPIEKWSRSGINVLPIIQKSIAIYNPIVDNAYVFERESSPEIDAMWEAIVKRCAGRSWADISYDSDSDFE